MSSPCHCILLRKATRKIGALYDAALEPVGINIAQFSLLRTVARHQAISLTDLGRRLELDRSTMGRNVRVVEKLGLVVLGRGEDQREATVGLTAHGREVLQAAEPLWSQCQDAIGDRLGPARIGVLAELNTLI